MIQGLGFGVQGSGFRVYRAAHRMCQRDRERDRPWIQCLAQSAPKVIEKRGLKAWGVPERRFSKCRARIVPGHAPGTHQGPSGGLIPGAYDHPRGIACLQSDSQHSGLLLGSWGGLRRPGAPVGLTRARHSRTPDPSVQRPGRTVQGVVYSIRSVGVFYSNRSSRLEWCPSMCPHVQPRVRPLIRDRIHRKTARGSG